MTTDAMTKSEDNYEADQGVAEVAGAASQKAESEANYKAEQEVAEVASQKAESEANYEAEQEVAEVAGAASQKAESEANYEAEQEVAEVAGAASQKAESEANYQAFQKRLPKLLKSRHKGRYALMHNLKIKEFFMDYDEAVVQGHKRYRGNPFSVQHITDEPTSIYEPTDL